MFPTDYENYVAHVQVMIDFGQELKRSKESWDRFVVSFANSINRAREKENTASWKTQNDHDTKQRWRKSVIQSSRNQRV